MILRSFSFVLLILFLMISGSEMFSIQQPKMETSRHNFRVTPLSREDVVKELSKRIQESQVQTDRPYRFPMTWQQDKGVYPSDVKLNLAGEPQLALVRDYMSVFDNNMFATTWITICLLETHLYGRGPRPSDSQLTMALEAVGQYHDKNLGYNNSIMNFWPQVYNQTTGMWESTPTNLLKAFHVFDVVPVRVLEEVLKVLGMGDLEHFLESVLSMRSIFERAFHIPPDFDDTFVNLGLGALLKDLDQEFPEALDLWTSQNSNLTSALDALKRYAYRPFSQDQNVNTIDTRTYYYIRHFLEEAQARNEDIALVPTWVQNLDEVRRNYYRGVAMPFQMNNVDVTVSANAIYGLTASVLSGTLPSSVLTDPQVYVNTSAMVASQINHGLYERPDIELTYYPSVMEFYWFVARTLFRMESAALMAPLPPAMQEVYQLLKPALESSMSTDVVRKARRLSQDMLYFDDFLGDGDVDRHNKTVIRGEDRLFTTSMAVNALLSTWTLFDDVSHTLRWKDNTPAEVLTTVEQSVRFLDTYILKDTYRPWNVFFSGSMKGSSTSPFSYPTNRLEYLNGTAIHDHQHFPQGGPFLLGMQGVLPEPQYLDLVRQKHFGESTPTHFTSFNQPGNYFPFWTSSAYTHATAMLALSRFDNIVTGGLTRASG
ncbi:uncharacterized protein LOC143295856 isoform X2 [Babylonia areolata]|uniref:uncharacterized protein LOC143295856 isoform X2 n=1 Tax=Babylonia areolata TaxID=304850 RepID=UPI003FD196E2